MKRIVPLNERMKPGNRSTLPKPVAKKRTSTPITTKTLEEIKAEMKEESAKSIQKIVQTKTKRPLKETGKVTGIQKARHLEMESSEGDPEMMALYKRVNTKARQKKELALIPAAIREAHKKKPLYGHQLITLDLYRSSNLVLDFGDPGTGKTRVALQAFSERRRKGGGKALILAPRNLLEPAWGHDAKEFCADMKVSVGYAFNRPKAFTTKADIYITNVDGIKWLLENKHVLKGFDTIIIDELTVYKHRSSQRSKAIKKLVRLFKYRAGLTGTPNSRIITDLWHQVYLIDDGKRLGTAFQDFQNATCNLYDREWCEKPGAQEAASSLIADISVRHRFEDCMDIPKHHVYFVTYEIPPKLKLMYDQFEMMAELKHDKDKVEAVNAAVMRNKLLQIASGAVYGRKDEFDDASGDTRPTLVLDTGRSDLVIDLVQEVDFPCLVFFCWGHQKEQLIQLAEKRGIPHALLDKTTPDARRTEIVDNFQAGLYKVLFLHPKTGAHGLTLTRGRRTICVSPFPEADFVKQVIHRTYRGGQTNRTETIMIEARDTCERITYNNRDTKYGRMKRFLELCELDPEAGWDE